MVYLERDGDLDAVDLTGEVLDGQDGSHARILECTFTDCSLDGARLDGTRASDTTWTRVRAGSLSAVSATWLDCRWDGSRLGAVEAHGSEWTRVEVHGGKVDYLNLRDARLTDVRLVGVVVDELDLARVTARRVVLDDCRVRRIDVSGARLEDVDLRSVVGLGRIDGLDGLRGARITQDQLLDLAPLVAAHLGLVVG